MSTDNEFWQNTQGEENAGNGRDGNQYYREGAYGKPSYNNERRTRRPRFNNDELGRQRTYGSRNNNGENGYGGYNNGERSYRPRYNNDDRQQRGGYGNRPYRPRYNNENGGGEYGGEQRSYRPRYNSDNRQQRGSYGNSDRPYRPRYNNENGANEYNGEQRPYRPRYNSDNRQQRGGYGSNGYNRQQRPRTADYNPNAKYSKKKQIQYREQFVDPDEPIRLNKYLANAGICSRREADEFITAGVVSVNGEVVTELGTKVKRSDEVKFHDEVVSIEKKVYVLLNKPKNIVTTCEDPNDRGTVLDLVKGACEERIYPVGRLDKNTTGVLLLTNDGDLASKLTHPKYLKKKIYHVHLDKNVTKADMEHIAAGVELEDGVIQADAISYTDDEKKDNVGIEIHSGKNRVVRRIFETLGYRVKKLDRVYFAGLTKKGLRRGDWRYLTEKEVNFLRMGSFE